MTRDDRTLHWELYIEEIMMAIAARSADATPEDDSIETMTREEGMQLLDHQARKYLGMSGEEFVRRYREGRFEDRHELNVARISMLLPLADL